MSTSWLKDLSLKNRSNSVKTFKSYVNLGAKDTNENHEISPSSLEENFSDVPPVPYPEPRFLPGEVLFAKAENVLKFNTLSDLNKGISGILTCTNFKLSFSTAESFPSNSHQRNLLLGENDICLINIDAIYQVVGGKRKKICNEMNPTSVEILEVHCKDFRIYTFSFKFSPTNLKPVIGAILHFVFAPSVQRLFIFDYNDKSPLGKGASHSLYFTKPSDWEAELARCKCPGWRLCLANEKFLLCDSLPEAFIAPSVLLDTDLSRIAHYFSGRRFPTWSWGLPSGASIVRMGSQHPGIVDNNQVQLMVKAISEVTPCCKKAEVFNADELCPSVKDIQSSFLKLKELSMPTTAEEYWEVDNTYLSRLESTKWLHNVSSCLSVALKAASVLQNDTSVVFVENEGKDVSCILSSLVQLFLDPSYHTQLGFQNLIQKEWIAMGHPFTDRLRHICDSKNEESPVFLLFLDCVWQLLQQCPSVFEFTETYLTTIWDSCHVSTFDTFLFNSHKCRLDGLNQPNTTFRLRSVWNWTLQFTRSDIKLFQNPFYLLNKYQSKVADKPSRPQSFSSLMESRQSYGPPISFITWADSEENLLKIDSNIKSLKLWQQCYFRWIPLAHIVSGGTAVLLLKSIKLADEITTLEKLSKLKNRPPSLHRRTISDDLTISLDLNADTSQIHDSSQVVTSLFPFSPVAPWDWQTFQPLPSTSCLQVSYCSDDDLDD